MQKPAQPTTSSQKKNKKKNRRRKNKDKNRADSDSDNEFIAAQSESVLVEESKKSEESIQSRYQCEGENTLYFAPNDNIIYLFDPTTKSFVKHFIKGDDFKGITDGYASKQLADGTIYFIGGFYKSDKTIEACALKIDVNLNATYMSRMIKPRWFESAALMRDRYIFIVGGQESVQLDPVTG